jgi:D-alanyl-D-alanine carboxypeptidase/D-alanyl-D-alanine-endopeptidase (penicillin-binding protein 4)
MLSIPMKITHLVWAILVLFPPVTAAAEAELPPELAAAIKDADFSTDGIGLFIQGVDDDRPVVAFRADRFLNPASVIKLATTAAALDLLGQGYRWSTEVMYTGTIKEHTLNGDLYIRGNGDPYLTPERFWRLLNRIYIAGIHRINGDVLIDNSYFEPGKVDYAAFDQQPYRTYNVGPNAVLVGFQATEFHFDIDTTGTEPAVEITPFPQSPRLRIINRVKPVNGRCNAWQKRLSLETRNNAGILEVVFTGNYARACKQRTLYRRVSEAQDHYQHYFLPLWKQIGGSVEGKITQGIVPVDARRVFEEPSISLAEAVRLVNKFSNNVMTRQILLTIGAQKSGPPGTTEKGLDAVDAWLVEHDLDHSDLQLDNGAGLSRDARISAGLLGRLLLHVYKQAYMPEFIAALPVAGYDGTMAHRFNDTPLVGRAHIKTGLLDFVQSMAGYVTTASGKRYVVVLLHNDTRAHTRSAQNLQNQVINWIYELK